MSPAFGSRGFYRCRENAAQFIAFANDFGKQFLFQQLAALYDLKPDCRFVELFQNDAEFVSEIGVTFRSTSFSVIRSG